MGLTLRILHVYKIGTAQFFRRNVCRCCLLVQHERDWSTTGVLFARHKPEAGVLGLRCHEYEKNEPSVENKEKKGVSEVNFRKSKIAAVPNCRTGF